MCAGLPNIEQFSLMILFFELMALTEKKVSALDAKDKRYTVTDTHGLTLRVYPTGTKTWFLRLCTNGRAQDISLGKWPEISLKHARQLARRKKKQLGLEPPKGYVFRDAFRIWVDLKKGRIVSYKDERRMLENHLLPYIGNKQLDEISAPLIIHTVKPILQSGKQVTLKRVVMRCREILDLAVCAGYIQHNPIERLNRIYAPPIVTPMPSIHWKDLPAAMNVMAKAPRKMQVIFLWSLCSMLRPGETAKLKWSWIESDILIIPSEEMKKKREHRVPLTDQLTYLLREAKTVSKHPKSSYIFPGVGGSKPMSSQTLAKYLHSTELKGRLVAHGLRSIARGWLADHEYQYEPSEACLAHLTGSAVSRAYQRSDFLDTRRSMMNEWNSYVFHCAESAGIIVSDS